MVVNNAFEYMKNPYEILNVPQDANNGAILKAQMTAMREKKFTNATK